MATRGTLLAAQELMNKFQDLHPTRRIEMRDKSSERVIGRLAAKDLGLTVIEEVDALTVKVYQTEFEVVEVRTCRGCGTNYTTKAIGEDNLGLCRGCDDARRAEWQKELTRRTEDETRRMKEINCRNRWEE